MSGWAELHCRGKRGRGGRYGEVGVDIGKRGDSGFQGVKGGISCAYTLNDASGNLQMENLQSRKGSVLLRATEAYAEWRQSFLNMRCLRYTADLRGWCHMEERKGFYVANFVYIVVVRKAYLLPSFEV